MKELNEILRKLEELQEERKENATKEPKKGEFSEAWDRARKAYSEGDQEKEEAARKEMDKIQKVKTEYQEKENQLCDLIKIYKENYKYLVMEALRPVVETTIKKFEGKAAGPKTKEKIAEAIEKELNIDGVKLYVNHSNYDAHQLVITIYFKKLSTYGEDSTINIYDVLNCNKITVTESTKFACYSYFKFIENPVEFLKINRAKRETINKKRLELLHMVEAYNQEQPTAFQEMDYSKMNYTNFGVY